MKSVKWVKSESSDKWGNAVIKYEAVINGYEIVIAPLYKGARFYTMTKNGVSTSEYGYHSLANAKYNALELAGA